MLQAKSVIAAAVPAHGTVVYRVRPEAKPWTVAPAVIVGAHLGTLVPGAGGGGTLTTTVTNRGVDKIKKLAVTVRAPDGWTVTASTSSKQTSLARNTALETTWAVTAPAGTAAGRYPMTLTAAYRWGDKRVASSTSELISVVVNAPADGRRHLSAVPQVSSVNARGAVEIDQSNGGDVEGDGSLITLGGRVYTRGLGTTAPSEIGYYLGGRCSRLVTEVGIDDKAGTTVPASFTVYADDAVAASSGPVTDADPPKTLTADLTGATWLKLVTTGSAAAPDGTTINDPTDWAAPILTCGDAAPDDPVQPVERTLYSFESGTHDWTIANPDSGGTVARSAAFHTDGAYGLEVATPTGGNWFGRALSEPLDLTGSTMLKFDVKAGEVGSSGEIAVQVGAAGSWCQGGLWAWTGPNSSRTVTERISQIGCPAGVTLDLTQIRGIWVFLNGGGTVHIDTVRAE